jgi:uncharacterized protein affecting Mg2+/Co2+ transport
LTLTNATLVQQAGGTYTGTGALILSTGSTFNVGVAASLAPALQLGQYGGSASITGTGTLTLAGGADLRRGTIAAPVVNAVGSTVVAKGVADLVTFNGTFTNAGTFQIEGTNVNNGNSEVNFTGTLTNAGTIVLTSTNGSYVATLDAASGSIINDPSGIINVDAGTAGARTINGAFTNAGTVNLNAATTFNIGTGTSGNSGSGQFKALMGASEISGTGTFNNAAELNVAAGASLTLTNATLVQQAGGTYTGTGALILSTGSTFNVGVAASLAPALQLGQYGGSASITGTGTLTLAGGADLRRGTIAAPVVNAVGSTVVAKGVADLVTFNGTFTNAGTFQIEGTNANNGNSEVNFTGTLTNAGTIVLTSTNGSYDVTLDAASGSIINNPGGVINVNAGSAGARTINGLIINTGTVNLNAATTWNIGSGVSGNAGSGQLKALMGGSTISGSGIFNNAAEINVASGASLSFASATLVQQTGGTYTGTGALILSTGSTFNVGVAASLAPALQLGQYGGSAAITGSAALTLTGGGDLRHGTIFAPVVNAVGSTVVAKGVADLVTFNGTFTNAGTFQIEGTNVNNGNSEVNFASTLINTGTIVLTSSNGSYNTTLDAAAGSIDNQGSIDVNAGTAGVRTINGLIINTGTVNLNAATTWNIGSGTSGNSGSGQFNALVGGSTLSGSGTFNNAAQINVASGASLTFASATLVHQTGGTYTGTGALILSTGSTFNVGVAASVGSALQLGQYSGSAAITGSATLTLTGGGDLRQGTIAPPVVNAVGSTLKATAADNLVTFNGTFTNAGTFQIEGTNAGAGTSEVNFAGMVTNTGTIVLTSSAGSYNVTLDAAGVTVDNQSGGSINVNAGSGGTRTLKGAFTNGGTVSIDANTTIDIGATDFVNQSGGVFSIATLRTVSFTGSGSAKFHNQSGATLNVTVAGILNMNGRDLLNEGTISGIGVISMGGGTFTQSGTSSIVPGASPGKLTIDGNAVFGGRSTIDIELGGVARADHDLFAVTGSFGLGGTLDVMPYNGFSPSAGDVFEVVTYGSRTGMFDAIDGLDRFGGVALDPIFTETGLTLQARAVTAEGSAADDTLIGTAAPDVLVGREGADILRGAGGDDLLLGGAGDDRLAGGAGNDRLIGGDGRDIADYSDAAGPVRVDLSDGFADDGAGGRDTLIGIEGVIGSDSADRLLGNAHDNTLTGGRGADVLTGGAGADTFVLRGLADAGDTITDFTSGTDRIEIDATAFGLAPDDAIFSVIAGPYDGRSAGENAAYAAGRAALIYSAADHTLYYDGNGAGEGYTVLATLQPGAVLAATDLRLTEHALS